MTGDGLSKELEAEFELLEAEFDAQSAVTQLIGRQVKRTRDDINISILVQHTQTRRWLADELANTPEWRATPLGELLVGLDQLTGSPIGGSLSVRSSNALGRARLKTWEELARRTPDWLRNQPNVGAKSLQEIVEHALDSWATAHVAGDLRGNEIAGDGERCDQKAGSNEGLDSPSGHALVQALTTVLAWAAETRGVSEAAAALSAATAAPEPLPESVRDAVAELASAEIPESVRHQFSLAAAFEELEAKDADAFVVFRKRRLEGAKRPTLDELGGTLGVTRERVRQIENRFAKHLEDLSASGADWPIGAAAERIRMRFGPLLRADEVPELQRVADPGGQALHDAPHRVALLLRLAGDYRVTDDWLVVAGLDAKTDRVLSHLTESGPVDLQAACVELTELEIREALQVPWIETRKEFRVLGDMVVRWGRSMRDKAVAILQVAGEPLELEDLFERIGEQRNFRAFKQQVQGDERIRRQGLKLYGLAEWGGEEYTTIVDEMTEELERNGGSMDLAELARVLAENFGVAESSVHMYAKGAQFELDDSGEVRRRTGKAPVPRTRPLPVSRRCFRREKGWAFKRTVDHDVLRGSGGGIPMAFAKELGLTPGESRTVRCEHGDVLCSWRSHMTHIGSLRAIAETLGAEEGDHLFLTAVGQDLLEVAVVAARACASESGWERLALECGRERKANGSAQDEVALALGFDPEDPDLDIAIRMRLQERGETDLADLVPRSSGSHGGDVLDLLASLGD